MPINSNLTASCNADCGCRDMPYDPVCGANSVLYFSPCHAGCSSFENIEGKKVRISKYRIQTLNILHYIFSSPNPNIIHI